MACVIFVSLQASTEVGERPGLSASLFYRLPAQSPTGSPFIAVFLRGGSDLFIQPRCPAPALSLPSQTLHPSFLHPRICYRLSCLLYHSHLIKLDEASHFTSEKPFPVISSKTASFPLTVSSREQTSSRPCRQNQEAASPPATPKAPCCWEQVPSSPFAFRVLVFC